MKHTLKKLVSLLMIFTVLFSLSGLPSAQAAAPSIKSNWSAKTVAVRKISMNKTSLTLNMAQSGQLRATLSPANSSAPIRWSSSNSLIVQVNQSGTLTPRSPGSCYVYAKAGDKTCKCKVTVKAIPVRSISLPQKSITLKSGESYTIKPSVKPSNATYKNNLSYSTTSSGIASVSGGKITARNAGNATITVRSKDGKTAQLKVRVIPVLAFASATYDLKKGASKDMAKELIVKGGISKNKVTFSSSNPKVVSVSSSGRVKVQGYGKATLTAKYGSVTAKTTIYVEKETVKTYKKQVTLDNQLLGTDEFTVTVDKNGIKSVSVYQNGNSQYTGAGYTIESKSKNRYIITTQWAKRVDLGKDNSLSGCLTAKGGVVESEACAEYSSSSSTSHYHQVTRRYALYSNNTLIVLE